ncbi:MAG: hypothetical protein SVS85_04395, partial [Candidatus Nanohaloarchaea archaeon]|nr:hypothetical protein [Candidatus Nanohaloarchaea archaeon]
RSNEEDSLKAVVLHVEGRADELEESRGFSPEVEDATPRHPMAFHGHIGGVDTSQYTSSASDQEEFAPFVERGTLDSDALERAESIEEGEVGEDAYPGPFENPCFYRVSFFQPSYPDLSAVRERSYPVAFETAVNEDAGRREVLSTGLRYDHGSAVEDAVVRELGLRVLLEDRDMERLQDYDELVYGEVLGGGPP